MLFDHLAEKEKRRTSKVNISWEILAPIIGLQLILMTVALVSCVKEEETNGPKWLWILIIVCINLIGPVLYFILGRKRQ
nr:PLD nuclease N-terminal domain-containing protein [Lederbergia galactosidilytica]